MKLLPYGRMLPVHCCCEPAKRLGWVPCGADRPKPVNFVAGHPRIDLETGVVTQPAIIRTEVSVLHVDDDSYLAVKSAEQPIETWRKVAGFIEERR